MATKRQTTMAKLAREQAVRERRARKLEKREKKRAARAGESAPETADGVADAPAATTEQTLLR
jgi:hypothetical protein